MTGNWTFPKKEALNLGGGVRYNNWKAILTVTPGRILAKVVKQDLRHGVEILKPKRVRFITSHIHHLHGNVFRALENHRWSFTTSCVASQ